MKLKDVAHIRTGLVLSRKKCSLHETPVHAYKLITLKSFTLAGTLDEKSFDMFDAKEQVDDEYITQQGDILIKLREPVIAAYIGEDQENLLIPSLVSIIRLKKAIVSPRFLAYLINSKMVSRQLKARVSGTTIETINNRDLEAITLSLPSLAEQEKIVQLMDAGAEEISLLEKLMKRKQNYYNTIFDTLTTKEERL